MNTYRIPNVVVYLAGAIRDGNEQDRMWRENLEIWLTSEPEFRNRLVVLSPLAGKEYDHESFQWRMHGMPPTAQGIYYQDVYSVKCCDIVFANMQPFDDGHPCIGTFMELGIAAASGKIIIVATENETIANHPFIQAVASYVGPSPFAIQYLRGTIRAMLGLN